MFGDYLKAHDIVLEKAKEEKDPAARKALLKVARALLKAWDEEEKYFLEENEAAARQAFQFDKDDLPY